MMARVCFLSPASSCLLLLVFSSSLIMSKPLPQRLDSTTLNELIRMIEEGSRSLVHGEDSAQSMTSSLRVQKNLSEEAEALEAVERELKPGQAWYHHLFDFMGHQNKFKGRTKKNVRERLTEAELGELTEVLMG